jgi:flagellar protein FliO/FliZ
MEYADYLRFFVALLFVVGLIGGTGLLARRFGLAPGAATGGRAAEKRLEIVETIALDTKRRMMLVRRDGTEHLILLGTDQETVIETGIERPAALPVTIEDAAPASADPGRSLQPAGPPTADDDVFARLRKVADLMNEKRALALRTGKTQRAAARATPPRKTAGDRA